VQAHYALAFEREMGCTAQELRSWLPGACAPHAIAWGEHGVEVTIDGGRATIAWQVLEARRIALMALPRLLVRFEARNVGNAAWQGFMHRFDLFTQRGGG
jgi:hypothetical protein